MTTRRIAIVVPGLATAGGVPAVAAFLYREMICSGRYEPHLFSVPMSSRDKSSVRLVAPNTWLRGPTIETETWNGWQYQHIGAIGSEFEFQRYLPRRQLTRVLSDFDLIQVVAGTPAWGYATRHLHVPVCLQVATLTMVERQALFKKTGRFRLVWIKGMSRIVSRIEDAALLHLKKVFVENQWMYKYLRKKINPSKVIYAPPGVNEEHFFPVQYKPNGHILSVGRFADPRKNVPLLFKAYHRLRMIFPGAPSLVLAGKSMPDSGSWQLAESLGIAAHIKTMENVHFEKLVALYQDAALFVLPSDEEGLGIVLLEAMASGIPVVATRCGGPESVVLDKQTGFLVSKNDVHALADRMALLLSDSDQAKHLGMMGRKRVEKEFSSTVAAKRFFYQYDRLLP